jgi:hypothetical protein
MSNRPDSIRSGAIAGLLGTFGDFVVHSFFYLVLGTSMSAHYISELIFPNKDVSAVRFLFGLFTHFCFGAFVGILLYLMIRLTGKDDLLLKSIGLGISFWIIHVILIPNLVDPRPYLFRTELEALVDLIAHTCYGLTAAAYLKKINIPDLKQSSTG